jgi:hypothetical protein
MKTPYSVLAALLLCSAITATSGEVYRWVDDQGRVQYSDQPPAGAKIQKITPKPSSGAQPKSGPKSYQEQDQEFRKRRVEEAESAKKQADTEREAKAKQKNCAESKAQLASLQSGGRITRTNDKGEREFLDEKAIEGAIAEARKAVGDWCK